MGEHAGTNPTITDVLLQGGRHERVGPVLISFEHGKVDPEAFKSFQTKLSYEFQPTRSGGEVLSGAGPKLDVELQIDNFIYSSNAPQVKCK